MKSNFGKLKKLAGQVFLALLIAGLIVCLTSQALLAEIASSGDNPVATTTPDSTAVQTDQTSVTDSGIATPSLTTGSAADAGSASSTEVTNPLGSATNSSTGQDSANTSQTNINNTTAVNNSNTATTSNNSYLNADTGHNHADYNTGSGIITTANASGKGEIVNLINLNRLITDGTGGGTYGASNSNTGENSTNEAEVNVNNQLTVKNINTSNTINQVLAQVYSGENTSNHNTAHGIILTGDANLGLNFVTMANANITGAQTFYADWQNVYSNYQGNVDLGAVGANSTPLAQIMVQASNKNTGENSTNSAIVNVNDQTTVTNQNSGKINNEINAKVVSGRNASNYNTGTGSVTTGKSNSAVNVVNFLNTNINSSNVWLKTLNVFGDWKGDIILPKMAAPNLKLASSDAVTSDNSGTGESSGNTAQSTVTDTTSVDNSNDATITNNVAVKTNTGNNLTSYNGGSGIIKFGESDAETNELNIANVNVTGDSWWMVQVNKFGSWLGTTIGSPQDMQVASDANSTILTPQNSGIKLENTDTGPLSNNIAGANVNHTTDLANANAADIVNNINIEAVSGENSTEFNTGHGYIESGDVKASNNIINFANANINTGNWLVTTVNVFGNWVGNLIFNTGDNLLDKMASSSDMSALGSSSASNASTGSDSSNSATTDSQTSNTANSANTSDVTNGTSASSLTGQNNANYNTGSGIVSTGAADTGSAINNQINTNNVAIGSSGTSTSTASNSDTGESSSNTATQSNATNNNVENNNNVVANNNLSADNSTGQNSSNYNVGNGIVDTSWAKTYLGLYNQVNSNTLTMNDLNADFSLGSHAAPADTGTTTTATSTDTTTGNNSGGDNNSGNNGGSATTGGSSGGSSGGGGSIAGALLSSIKGDLNGDNKVNDFDFSILMANWGASGKTNRADINKDNIVDLYDYSILMSNWNHLLLRR